MASLKKLRDYIVNRWGIRRVLFVLIGVIGVVVAVLLIGSLGNLLDRPTGSQAAVSENDVTKTWQSLQKTGAVKTPHSKMTIVRRGDQAWLYVIGGVEVVDNVFQGRKQTQVLNQVRRIEIDSQTGAVIGSVWEGGDPDGTGPLQAPAWGTMNFGHMEFGLVEANGYLYVIAGDLNVPTLTQAQQATSSPLPYSTIERLSLASDTADWEVFSLLSGVNYYPEVTFYKNYIHVVGGVLGVPFPPLPTSDVDNFMGDIINGDNPATREQETHWGSLGLGNKPVVGNPGLTLAKGGLGDNVLTGSINNTRRSLQSGIPQQGVGSGTGTGGGGTPDQNQNDGTPSGTETGGGAVPGLSSLFDVFKSRNVAGVQIQQTGGVEDIYIVRPNGNEVFAAGTVEEIRWYTPPLNPGIVDLTYSVDGGTTWKPVSGGTGIQLHFNNCIPEGQIYSINCFKWTVPNEPTKNALVRISGRPFGTNFADASDGYFEITGTYFSEQFLASILSGDFATTVSEYYKINPANPTNPEAFAGELGSDYTGTFSNVWAVNKASRLDHVRFTLTDSVRYETVVDPIFGTLQLAVPDPKIVPLPQGRYGHKLLQDGTDALYVIGGASWQKELVITTNKIDLPNRPYAENKTEHFKMFWVTDDARHPFYDTDQGDTYNRPEYNFGFGRTTPYEFHGNVSYKLAEPGNSWIGTNPTTTVAEPSGSPLASRFATKDSDGSTSRGRAFFGLGNFASRQYLTVGGLTNVRTPLGKTYETDQFGSNPRQSYFRAPVEPTSRVEKINFSQGTTASWNREVDSISGQLYNLQVGNLDGGLVTYTGQEEFQYPFNSFGDVSWRAQDARVPDYAFPFSPKTSLYIDRGTNELADRWYEMSEINADSGELPVAYVEITPGSHTVASLGSKQYRAVAYDSAGNPINSDLVTFAWRMANGSFGLGNIVGNHDIGDFTAFDTSGSGRVEAIATHNGSTITGQAYVRVYQGTPPTPSLRYVRVTPGSVRVGLQESRTFTAQAFDQYGNAITSGVNYSWSMQDSRAGTISFTGQFTSTSDDEFTGQTFADAIRVSATTVDGSDEALADVVIKPSEQAQPLAAFGSDVTGRFGAGNNVLTTIYHFGGLGSDILHLLGQFGTPSDPANEIVATVTVMPGTILPDDASFGLVKVKLANGLGQPLWGNGNNRYGTRIDTERSPGPVASTDGTYRNDNVDRAELLGASRIPDDEVGFSDLLGEYVYLDDDTNTDGLAITGPGEAVFRIYSKELTALEGTELSAYIEIFGDIRASLQQPATTMLKVAWVPGLPSALNSSIVAVPTQVAADNVSESTVTVTLKDYQGNPADGYYVRLISDRNADGVVVDRITPAAGSEPLVQNGVATFHVKSAVKGRATLRVSYDKVKAAIDDEPDLPNSATVQFAGVITSLTPDNAKQGQGPFIVTAVGTTTDWKDIDPDKTVVSFVPPSSVISFNAPDGYIYPADGFRLATFEVVAPEHAGRVVTVSIQDGDGRIFGSPTMTLNADGRGQFVYETGTETGPVEIKAQVTSGPSEVLMIMLGSKSTIQRYFLQLSADAPTITPDGETVIRAGVYRNTTNGVELVSADIDLNPVTLDGTFDPTNPSTQDGLGAFTYQSGERIGINHIFVSGTYDGTLMTEMVDVAAQDDSAGITFDPSSLIVANNTPGAGQQTLNINGVTVSPTAYLGEWTFRTTTQITADFIEVIDHVFTVYPDTRPKGPRITSIVPNLGFRGDVAKTITINAADTNFFFEEGDPGSSEVSFTPSVAGGDPSGITVAATRIISNDEIEVDLNIATNAVAGFWNVKVETSFGADGTEVAELVGNSDFLVTTQSDYIIDINPSPIRIPRDGRSSSKLNTFVGKINRLNGQMEPVAGAVLTYSFVEPDGGRFDQTTATTGADGTASVKYITDSGTQSQFVKIAATTTVDGLQAFGFAGVIKEVRYGNFLTLTAVPDSLPLAGTPATSVMTVDAVDADGNPIYVGSSYIPVDFYLMEGTGQIVPLTSELRLVQGRAQAVSTYYRQDGLTIPETAVVVAAANLPGIGFVFSNDLEINLGQTSSEYTTTFTCEPTSCATQAGSNTPITLTATLTRLGAQIPQWPISFSLTQGGIGDYLTVLAGVTDANGQVKTKFVPGSLPGFVIASAKPVGLNSARVTISKTVEDIIDPASSTLSAVPSLVPANNIGYSQVTVTVRNRFFTPLPGKVVTISSSRGSQDTISAVPGGGAVTQAQTNLNGQAIFYVRSGVEGMSTLSAIFGGYTKTAQVEFDSPADLVTANFNIKVQLEAREYDGQVAVYLTEAGVTAPIINEVYTKLTDGSHLLSGIPQPMYFHANKTHSTWVKAKNHLARSVNFTTGAGGTQQTITVDVPALLIGDVSGVDGTHKILPAFHDNSVNGVDFQPIHEAWTNDSYLTDYWRDFQVNSVDLLYWIRNFGSGTAHP